MERSYGNELTHSSTANEDNGRELRDISRGMSQSDFMLRQRYVENSGYKNSFYQSVSAASHPAELHGGDVRHFVQEQRKIIANFKAQPWPMQMKMAARKAYLNNLSKYTEDLNTVDTFRDMFLIVVRRLKRKWSSFIEYITIWSSIIKKIEGRFGSSVASFFTFLRWMCALNFFLSLMILGFLVIPQSIGGHGLDTPASVKQNRSAFSFIIDGKGYLFEYSVLFYGYYDSGLNEPHYAPPFNPQPQLGWGYKLPLSYLLTVSGVFVASIIATIVSMAKNYKIHQRATISEQYLFAWKIFASWDYTISNKEMVTAKARQITVALKETIMEAEKVTGVKWYLFFIRLVSQIIVTVILLASCYAIYLAVEESRGESFNESLSDTLGDGIYGLYNLIKTFQVQIVVIARNLLLPYIFKVAELLEKHHPRTQLKILLIRLFLLYITSLYVMIIALLTSTNRCDGDSINDVNSTTLISALNFKRSIANTTVGESREGGVEPCCWETTIGQEMFNLSITHFLAEIFSIFANDILRWAIVYSKLSSRFDKFIGQAEFRLAENILRLIYGQALVWLGVLFCPVLLLISFVKILSLFYIRTLVVSVFNKPPRTMFRIASTRNFYLAILLTVTFLCLFPIGYAAIQISPSVYCGPFRGLESMIKILVYEIDTWPSVLRRAIEYMQTASVVMPGISLLFIAIFYYMTLVGALKDVNKDLRLQLHMEQTEVKERILKEVQERQGSPSSPSPSRSSNLKHRHRELLQLMQREQDSAHRIVPSHSTLPPSGTFNPTATNTISPAPFVNARNRERKCSIVVSEVEEDRENELLRDMTPYTPSPRPTVGWAVTSKEEEDIDHTHPGRAWSLKPNSTLGYVDTKAGATVRHTML